LNVYLYIMNFKSKKRLIWFIAIVVLLFIAVFTINFSLKKKLETKLKYFSETVQIHYKDIVLNALTGNLELIEPQIKIYGKTTDSINLKVNLQTLTIDGFSYWTYLTDDKIKVDKILFKEPQITYYHNNLVKHKTYKETLATGFKHAIEIESVQMINGKLEVNQTSNSALLLQTNALHFKIEDVLIASGTTKPHISYKNYSAKSSDLFFKISALESLTLKTFDINSEVAKFTDLKLHTKLSKQALSKYLKTERDHYNLDIDSIFIARPSFGLKQDSLFYFNSPHTIVHHADFEIYRDKLLPDDTSYKPLYSKMLRNLGFNLAIDTLQIKNTAIKYTEKVKANTEGGTLLFSELNADLTCFGNIYNDKTLIAIDAVFMNNTPLRVQWNFNVNNQNDAFIFKSEMGRFHAKDLNQYMSSNLNVKLEGEVEKLYFTIEGNDNTSHIDAKLEYEDFDVVILKKNGKEKNKLLSTVLNLFIAKNSKDKAKIFNYGTKNHLERDRSKSIFNFVWINLKGALMEAIMGSGNKED